MEEMWTHLRSGNICHAFRGHLRRRSGNNDATFSIIMMILRQNI